MKRILASLAAIILSASALISAQQPTDAPKPKHYYLDDVAQFVPSLANATLTLCGQGVSMHWRERIALTLTSAVICEGTTLALKHIVHSRRPDGSDYNSFPSGHTSRAFRGAEMLRAQHGWTWGAGGYAVAIGVGALRIHHHRHRFGDVAAGAAIGFLSARAAYLLLPLERRIFGWNRSQVTAVAALSITPGSISVTASVIF